MTQCTAPHSKESELMVLGCMLTQGRALDIAADALDETDFFFTEHRLLFAVLKEAYKRDKAMDVHLACEELKRKDQLDKVGGISFVVSVANYAGTSAHLEAYIELVQNHSLLRRVIAAAQNAQKIAMSNPVDVVAALDEIERGFFAVRQRARTSGGTPLESLIDGSKSKSGIPVLKEIQDRQELYAQRGPDDVRLGGLPTSFIDLDRTLNGLGDSNLIILAARPAMGKTALALNIVENVCFKDSHPVGIFSLEMTAEQIRDRMISSQSRIGAEKIKLGNLDGFEYQTIFSAVKAMMGHKCIIDDEPGLRITDLRARARRMREQYGVKLLMIDYLQLLSGSGSDRSSDGRQFEVAEISRLLKTLARELDIPIICLSQLSREVEKRTNHRPQLSDIRESGAIEQDADVVMMLWRRDYYDALDKPGEAMLCVAKNRHGAIGDVKLTFRKEYARFDNYAREEAAAQHNKDWDSLGT